MLRGCGFGTTGVLTGMSADIGAALKKQMIAERERRGDFIRAEGKKAAMTIRSEGTKLVKFNMGIAEQEATRKRYVHVELGGVSTLCVIGH